MCLREITVLWLLVAAAAAHIDQHRSAIVKKKILFRPNFQTFQLCCQLFARNRPTLSKKKTFPEVFLQHKFFKTTYHSFVYRIFLKTTYHSFVYRICK